MSGSASTAVSLEAEVELPPDVIELLKSVPANGVVGTDQQASAKLSPVSDALFQVNTVLLTGATGFLGYEFGAVMQILFRYGVLPLLTRSMYSCP